MFNRKHITALTTLAMAAVIITGCQENTAPLIGGAAEKQALTAAAVSDLNYAPSAAPEAPAATAAATPYTNGRVTVSCAIPESAPSQLPLYKAKRRLFEEGVPESVLFNEGSYKSREERPDDLDEEQKNVIYCNNDDILVMSYRPGDVYLNGENSIDKDSNFGYMTLRSWFDCYDMAEYFNDTELEGFSPEEAISKADAMLKALGINNLGTPKVWAITADKANEKLGEISWETKAGVPYVHDTWTKDDEVYFLTYPISVDGIPVMDFSNMSLGTPENMALSGSYVQVTVRRDRIATVNGFELLSENLETCGAADINVSAQQALDILIDHHNADPEGRNAEFNTEFTVKNCELVYVEVASDDFREFTLKPMWRFDLAGKMDLSGRSDRPYEQNVRRGEQHTIEVEFIDARTGEGCFEF